jgi:hypothetical protein
VGIVHRYHKRKGELRTNSEQGNYERGQGGPANAEYKRAQLGKNHTKENNGHRSFQDIYATKMVVTASGLPETE